MQPVQRAGLKPEMAKNDVIEAIKGLKLQTGPRAQVVFLEQRHDVLLAALQMIPLIVIINGL